MGRSDRDVAIDAAKELETLLERGMGARGRGLHEKISSVEDRLPGEWVRRARFIATMRNKLLHDADVTRLDDRRGFVRAADQCRKELLRLSRGKRTAGRRDLLWLALGLGVAAAVVAMVVALAGR